MKRTSTGTTYNISNFVRPENASFSSFCILLFWRYLHYERKKTNWVDKNAKTLITITPCTLKEYIAQMLFKIQKVIFRTKNAHFFGYFFGRSKKRPIEWRVRTSRVCNFHRLARLSGWWRIMVAERNSLFLLKTTSFASWLAEAIVMTI